MGKISNVVLPNGNAYDVRATAIPYGEVDSTSTSTVFTVTVPGITELTDGTLCYIRNNVVTSAANCTLNVNNLGAKPIYSSLAAASRSTTIFNINYTMMFIYNENRVEGGCWDCFYGYDSNTNTVGYQLRTYSQSLPMKSITYRYRLLFTSADSKHYVPANNSTSTNATASRTVCQDKIDPFGDIYYYGTTASVAADARPSASYLWSQYTLSLGYSFNNTGAALTLTLWEPVYVKCSPQTDGSAIIDSATPYVQTLPTTDDGKIYIFLGVAYSATNIELVPHHPVYYFKDGQIRLYTNQIAGGGGSTVSVTPVLTSGTNIAGISVDGVSTQLYAPTVPSNVSAFTNDAGYLTTETDPTVPSWAKQSSKPTYGADEILYDSTDPTSDDVKTILDDMETSMSGKQPMLYSGTNIKTINNDSLLGSGNIDISGGSVTTIRRWS